MPEMRARSLGIVAGLTLVLLGATLVLCSTPVFSYTREELQEVQRSEAIMNYSFDLNQSQDKMVQVQVSIGQKLIILATGSENFSFSIVNFTNTGHAIEPDHPDVTYLSLNSTALVNTTWSPQLRTAQPGNYYLMFLARQASSESPVQINANVTKIWTDLQTKSVVAPDRRPLIDPNFVYVGAGIVVFGATTLLVARAHRKTRALYTIQNNTRRDRGKGRNRPSR
jgi:hypothetical protein